jgi:hypothetical protein
VSERSRLVVLAVSLVAMVVVLSIGVVAARSNQLAPLPIEQRGCRLLGAAYLPGFDLPAQQVARFQDDALTRFGESTVPEVRRIIGDTSDARWAKLGAWCKANYSDDPSIRRTRYPAP